ncbi:Cytochrome c oxidase subunit 6b-1 [Zea mays]|uniref:Cytochrome c oxidase subunit 6b-1 n=1 Tax=Zea mays TaxID=4577 RepID=A0A1D6P7V9_MAIZE|nr:Cytochrome c oxidase subunit 6b-1 [Zea mays]
MAAEAKTPSLAEEYSLPPQEVPVEKAAEEKPSSGTETESAPSTNDETPSSVEDKNETSEVQDAAEKSDAEETNTAAEEASETAEEEEAEKPEIKMLSNFDIQIETAPADFRFPTTNQTRHCFTRYVEYHRCVAAKGEDAPECDKFAKYYRSLCPGEWVCIYCFHHYGLHTALVACCGVEIRKKYFEACGLCILS